MKKKAKSGIESNVKLLCFKAKRPRPVEAKERIGEPMNSKSNSRKADKLSEEVFECSMWTVSPDDWEKSRHQFQIDEAMREKISSLGVSALTTSPASQQELEKRLKAYETPVTESTLSFSVR